MDMTPLIIVPRWRKFVWIVPTIVIIFSLILGPLVIAESVFAEEKVPTKYVPDRLLIKFKKDTSNSLKDKLLKENDASVIAEIKQINVKLIKVPEQALEKVQAAFAKNSAVEYVEKDFILEPAIIPNDPYYPNQWHLPTIKAKEAWDITQGGSTPIAILDTGVDPNHPDLKNKLTLGYNFYNNNNDWYDVCGHGTKVAGSAAAITNNGLGVSGVSWNNPIIPIKITDASCYGYYSSMINGIVYAADKGARVANISFQIFNGASLSDAARYMNEHGGWVVAAAGNTGTLENYSDNPYIISVGSISSNGLVSSFSSYGPFVDFAAPGSSIYTTTNGGAYGYTSGTSFSSPIVSGVVALIIANNPSMNSQQVYDALKNSAVDKGTAGRDNYYGWGVVDAYGALLQNSPPPPPPDTTPPTVTITNPQNGVDVTGSFTVSVDSSDNVAVNKVELHLDGMFFAQKTTTPYNFALDANAMSVGTHELKAVSIDSSGNSNFAKISVNVVRVSADTTIPNVSITNPSEGSTVSGTIPVSVSATDNVAISQVELYVNNVFYSQKTTNPYDFSVDTKNLPSGSNVLKAKAFDSSNNYNEDINNILVQANTLPPSVAITNPANGGKVTGKVTISAQPSNFPNNPTVKFFIDGALKASDSSAPYEYGWPTKGVPSGSHTIMVVASDSQANSASASISVQIAAKGKPTATETIQGNLPQEVALLGVEGFEDLSEIVSTSSESPELSLIDAETVNEGITISIPFFATDQDTEDLLSFSAYGLPSFVELVDNGEGTGSLEVSPNFGDAGEYTITVTVSDNSEPESLMDSKDLSLTVLESTPASVTIYLQNQKSSLSSEKIKNLGESVSFAANLHKYLVGATKDERSDFQAAFHEYINEAKNILQIGQGVEQKIILQDISKTQLKLDGALEKLNIQEENEDKANDAKLLREKRQELTDTINQLIAIEHFIKKQSEKEKQIEELTAKKLNLMKEVMIEEARQSNSDLTPYDIKKIEEKLEQTNQKSNIQDNDSDKTNNAQGNGGKGNSSNAKNNSDKGNSGNKGGNGNSKK
jgi:hypothetical protein